jgi:hypothetical protein
VLVTGARGEVASQILPELARRHGVVLLARRVLGYAPEDDSEIAYAEDIRRLLTGPDAHAPGGRVGA